MEYRKCVPGDLAEITALIKGAVGEMERHGIYQWDDIYPTADDFAGDIEKGSLHAAVLEGRIAAVYAVNGECDAAYAGADWKCPEGSFRVIHRLCVAPAFQHRGIGKKVLSHIEDDLREEGFESVRLDVFTGNPHALRLYSGSGYSVRGFADWRKGRFELMEKDLRNVITTERTY